MVTSQLCYFFRYKSFFDLIKQVYPVISPPTYLYTSPLFDTWEATREELNESTIVPDIDDDQPGTDDPVEVEAEGEDEEEQHHHVEHPQLQQEQQHSVPEVQEHQESQENQVAEPQQQQTTAQDDVFVTVRRKRKAPNRYTPSKPSGSERQPSPVAGPSTAVSPLPCAKPSQKKITALTKKATKKYKALSPYKCPAGWKKVKVPLPPGLSSDSDFE